MGRPERLLQWRNAPRPVVTPSLLACDFARMADELAALARAGAVGVHLDVMDGHFVPNLSYGAPVIGPWRERSELVFDTHLMMSDPGRYLDDFVNAGCDRIIVHIEAVPEPAPLLRRIRETGCQAALALNPPTPATAVQPHLPLVDSILVMSVMPGFGGQPFDESVLPKVQALRQWRPDLEIAIDGGINPDTAARAAVAGVRHFVAGSSVFRRSVPNYAQALSELVEGARRGLLRGGVPAQPAEDPSQA
jgi:ribulose-phosphate 3-epimerase